MTQIVYVADGGQGHTVTHTPTTGAWSCTCGCTGCRHVLYAQITLEGNDK